MNKSEARPIEAGWKVSEVLKLHPGMLDAIASLSPIFGHLRNPVLRSVKARLVTVADAARMAGLDLPTVLRQLNQAAGLSAEDTAPPPAPAEVEAAPAWVEASPPVEELDVRPIIDGGGEPFTAIMDAAARVGAGQVLHLVNRFEPVPLYHALAKRGFENWTRRRDDGDWEVWFLRLTKQGGNK